MRSGFKLLDRTIPDGSRKATCGSSLEFQLPHPASIFQIYSEAVKTGYDLIVEGLILLCRAMLKYHTTRRAKKRNRNSIQTRILDFTSSN